MGSHRRAALRDLWRGRGLAHSGQCLDADREVFGQLGARQDAIGVTEPRFQVGLRWRPIDDFNIDLIYGRNIYGENANWITLATVVRFHVGQ